MYPIGIEDIEVCEVSRNDPVESIPWHDFAFELEYMGYKTLGEVIDHLDDILRRIHWRFPHFYDDKDYNEEDVREFLAQAH